MAKIVDNPNGRRMIRLSVDDILMIVSMYQQKCNTKGFDYNEVRSTLKSNDIYLPEEVH